MVGVKIMKQGVMYKENAAILKECYARYPKFLEMCKEFKEFRNKNALQSYETFGYNVEKLLALEEQYRFLESLKKQRVAPPGQAPG